MRTPELMAILQKKYCPPEWTFLTEVRNGTGFAKLPRTADALAFNLWPSRGMELHGFELKVSRADWLHELKDPAKAEALFSYCDRWWVVIGDEKIIHDHAELPSTWGLQAATPKGLRVIKEAPKNESPKPLDRHFIWASLRNYGAAPSDVIKEARREGYERGVKAGKESSRRQIEALTTDRDGALRRISEFEKQSGIKLNDWYFGNAAEVAKFLKNGGVNSVRQELNHLLRRANEIRDSIDCILTLPEPTPNTMETN